MSISAADRLQQAERILSSLEARLEAAQQRRRELATRRRAVAFKAETGDALAVMTRRSLREEAQQTEFEIEEIPSAIEGARAAIQAAETAVVAEQAAARANLPKVEKLRTAAAAADAALQAFVQRTSDLRALFREVPSAQLPSGNTRELVEIALRRALSTGIAKIGMGPAPPPKERATIADAVIRLIDLIEHRLRYLAGEAVSEPAEKVPELDEAELVGAEPEPGAPGLTDRDFEEVAEAASARFRQGIDAARAAEIWLAWHDAVEQPIDPAARWILKRLKLRNAPPSARPDGGF